MKIFFALSILLPIALFSQGERKYLCKKAESSIVIDGIDNETEWQKADWTDCFVDIEGDKKPKPYLKTRVKMLWDDTCIYFFAEIEEPHIWANQTQRESVIFWDNDFEIFIDPDGDTHNYTEFEINPLGTEWDLLLPKPYRNGGPAINSYDIKGLKSAVKIHGTINNPNDKDEKWTLEISMKWTSFVETNTNSNQNPKSGDIWRINFSRVEWETEVVDGKYVKKRDIKTGKNLSENNWVWSPHGKINMHMPEKWGYLIFCDSTQNRNPEQNLFEQDFETIAKMWEYYYKQKVYMTGHKTYSKELETPDCMKTHVGSTQFEIICNIPETNRTYYLNQDGLFRQEFKLSH